MAKWDEPMGREPAEFRQALERQIALSPEVWQDWDDPQGVVDAASAASAAYALSSAPKHEAMTTMFQARDDLMAAIREEIELRVRERRPVWLIIGLIAGMLLTILGQISGAG